MDKFIFNLEIANSSHCIFWVSNAHIDGKLAQKTKPATREYDDSSH